MRSCNSNPFLRALYRIAGPLLAAAAFPAFGGTGVFNASDYDFPAQSPATPLTAGVPTTISLSPCPQGVSGSVSGHPFALTSPNDVALTTAGGTCTPGAMSGTLIITPGATHAIGWQIRSATSGINEAVAKAKQEGGGVVQVGNGVTTIRARIRLGSGIWLRGVGEYATTIQVAANSWGALPAWQHVDVPGLRAIVDVDVNSTTPRISDLTIDLNGPNQTATNVSAAYFATSATATFNPKMENVTGIGYQGVLVTGILVGFYGNTNDGIVANSSFLGAPGCTAPAGPGGIFVQGRRHLITGNFLTNLCDEGYISNNAIGVQFIGNRWLGHAGSGPTAIHAEDSSDVVIVGNSLSDPYNRTGALINVAPSGAAALETADITIANNFLEGGLSQPVAPGCPCAGIGAGGGATTPVRRLTITGNVLKNLAQSGIALGPSINDSTVAHNTIKNISRSTAQQGCIVVVVPAASAGVDGLTIESNILDTCGNATSTVDGGILQIDTSASGDIKNVNVLDNVITDRSGSSWTDIGISTFSATPTMEYGIIRDNIIRGIPTAVFAPAANYAPGKLPIIGPNMTGGSDTMIGSNYRFMYPSLDNAVAVGQDIGAGYTILSQRSGNARFRIGANVNPDTMSTLLDATQPGWALNLDGPSSAAEFYYLPTGGGAGQVPLRVATSSITVGSTTFAALGAPANGTQTNCSNCDAPATPGGVCTSAGAKAGAFAVRTRGIWLCF